MSATPAREPDAPAPPVIVDELDQAVELSWSAPADDGGDEVTGYRITAVPEIDPLVIPDAGTTSATVPNLTNGQQHVFMVQAINGVGVGAESLFSEPAVPARVPDPPRDVTVEVTGDGELTVSWRFPKSNGDARIEGYVVTATHGEPPATLTEETGRNTFSATLTGLTPCEVYAISVEAENDEGLSPAATAPPIAAATYPDAPTVSLTAGDAQLTVSWDVGSDGCAPIESWRTCVVPGEIACEVHESGSSTVLEGLANGQAYETRVWVSNAVGESPQGAASKTPCGPPHVPLDLTASVAGDGAVLLEWLAPTWHGGCGIDEYQVLRDEEGTVLPEWHFTAPLPGARQELTIDELTVGLTNDFKVRASANSGSVGPWTNIVSIKVAGPPSPPRNVEATPGDGLAVVYWDEPADDGGSPVTHYELTASPSGATATVPATQAFATVTGLTNGVEATFTVKAVNAAGESDPSGASTGITPVTASLVAHALAPASVLEGESAVGTVTLDVLAPVGGVPVALAADDPDAPPEVVSIPTSVLVPEASLTAEYVIETSSFVPPPATRSVSLTATLGASHEATLSVLDSASELSVRIDSPADRSVVHDIGTPVEVTVLGAFSGSWTLERRFGDAGAWTEVQTGATEQDRQEVATFDPTLEINGRHQLRLRATDSLGVEQEHRVDLIVKGGQKVGHFTLEYQDLVAPVGQVPLQVVRSYNSRDPRFGDFGPAWQLSVRSARIDQLGIAGENWERSSDGDHSHCVRPGKAQRVVITLADESTHVFEPRFAAGIWRAECMPFAAPTHGFVHYVPVEGTRGSLRDLDDTNGDGDIAVFYDDINLQYGEDEDEEEVYDNPFTLYDPSDFVFTTQDGTSYEFIGGVLTKVSDRNGNSVEITDDYIEAQPSGKRIEFIRDAQDRITAIEDPLGNRLTYEYDDPGPEGRLQAVWDRELTDWDPVLEEWVTTGPGTRYTYHGTSLEIDEIHDPLGRNPTRAEYLNGRLTRLCDPRGQCIDFDHSEIAAPDRKETIFDRKGNVTVVEYDEWGQTVKRYDPGVVEPWEFTYSPGEYHELETEENPLDETTTYTHAGGFVASVTNGESETTAFTYGPNGTPTSVRLPEQTEETEHRFSVDDDGNITASIDPLGHVTHFTHDIHGNIKTVTDPLGRVTTLVWQDGLLEAEIDALGHRTCHFHAADGMKTKLRREAGPDDGDCLLDEEEQPGNEGDLVTEYAHDRNRRQTVVTHPDGTTTETTYHDDGQVHERIDQRHVVVESREYDLSSGLLARIVYFPDAAVSKQSTEEFSYDANGNLKCMKDRSGLWTYHEHDGLDRRIKTCHFDPDPWATCTDVPDDPCETSGNSPTDVVEMGYDAAGRLAWRRDERGHQMDFEHDQAGRQTAVVHPLDPDVPGMTYEQRDRRVTTYDDNGNVQSITDELGHRTVFERDAAEQVTREVYYAADDYETELADRHLGHDALGQRVSVIDENDKETLHGFDELGRLSSVTDPLGHAWRYEHDEFGNMVAQHDALDRLTQYTYDAMGRRTTRTLPLGQTETTVYVTNGTGQVDHVIDFNGRWTQHEYDSETDWLIATEYPDLPVDAADADAIARIEYVHQPDGLVEETRVRRGSPTAPEETRVQMWDERGRLERDTKPDGTWIEYGFDPAGNRTTVTTGEGGVTHATTTYTHDERNRLDTVTDPGSGVTTYTWDAAGNLDLVEYPSGLEADHDFDARNRLDLLEWRKPDGMGGFTQVALFDYTLDAAGNRRHVVEHDGREVTYILDDAYRLLEERIEQGGSVQRTIEYTYDAVGNRLSRDDSVAGYTSYSHDANDRLTGEGAGTVETDEAGRLTSVGTTSYVWDDADRLVEVSTPETVQFRYDENGNRIARVDGGGTGDTVEYLVDEAAGLAQVLEETENGALARRYTHGHRLLSQEQAGTTSHLVHDAIGSTRAVVDDALSEAGPYDYGAFGTELAAGAAATPHRFAGERWEEDLGLAYHRARWMRQGSGRFASQDPFEGVESEPATRHRYTYAANNPATFVDPSGAFFTISDSQASLSIRGVIGSVGSRAVDVGFFVHDVATKGAGQAIENAAKDAVTGRAVGGVLRILRGVGRTLRRAAPGSGLGGPAGAGRVGSKGQLTPNACGMACGQKVLAEVGINVFQSNLMRGFWRGLEPSVLAKNLNDFQPGWVGTYLGFASPRQLVSAARNGPFIARLGGNPGHFVVVESVDSVRGGAVHIWDPAGAVAYSRTIEDFAEEVSGIVWRE